VARSPGILPSECARALRGSLNAHPCACNELARIVRAILRTFPAHPRRATGAPFRRHPAAEATARTYCSFGKLAVDQALAPTQCRDARIHGRRHRSRCRASQTVPD